MTNDNRIGDWIQTSTGRQFWLLDPRPEDFSITEIAHSLAHQGRFGGHAVAFYSVAEHSVLVSHCVPPEHALTALMHDATEAYCIDVPRPLKRILGEAYASIERGIWKAMAEWHDLPLELPACVHEADNAVLLAEREVLMKRTDLPWGIEGAPARVTIHCYEPLEAKALFLQRYRELLLRESHVVAPVQHLSVA